MKANVTYWLDETAARLPDKTAFADEKKQVTFGQLRRQAMAVAYGLIERGFFKRPVAVFLEKGVDVLVSFMGAAYSCNFYSPIDVDMPGSRVNKILEVLNPAVVITTAALKDVFMQYAYQGDFLILEEALNACGQELEQEREDKIETARRKGIDTDLLPKGVTINHRSVIDYTDWVTETFQITEKDSFGNQAPFYFDNSILDIYSTIKTGATTYIVPKNLFAQPVLLLEYLKEKKINTIFWVPSALIVVAKLKAFRNVDLSETLKRVLFCGEVMPNKQLNVWRKFLPKVQYANLYGPTEITDACTYYMVDREFADEEPLPIGYAMPNTDILVLNDKNERVTGEESGELCVRGTSLSMGYYNNPEKTREAFVQNPLNPYVPELIYRTGDIVKYNERGELIYLSRKDFQIKHMGHRIELGEIETAVSSLEEISMCCCLYDEKRQKIVLFIEEALEKTYINEKISHLVPEYMLPNKLITVEKMPINANGKIDRVKLKELL